MDTLKFNLFDNDSEKNGECIGKFNDLEFDLPVHTCLLIKEI